MEQKPAKLPGSPSVVRQACSGRTLVMGGWMTVATWCRQAAEAEMGGRRREGNVMSWLLFVLAAGAAGGGRGERGARGAAWLRDPLAA